MRVMRYVIPERGLILACDRRINEMFLSVMILLKKIRCLADFVLHVVMTKWSWLLSHVCLCDCSRRWCRRRYTTASRASLHSRWQLWFHDKIIVRMKSIWSNWRIHGILFFSRISVIKVLSSTRLDSRAPWRFKCSSREKRRENSVVRQGDHDYWSSIEERNFPWKNFLRRKGKRNSLVSSTQLQSQPYSSWRKKDKIYKRVSESQGYWTRRFWTLCCSRQSMKCERRRKSRVVESRVWETMICPPFSFEEQIANSSAELNTRSTVCKIA